MHRRLYVSFHFILAVLYLCSKLTSRGVETSVLTTGLTIHYKFNDSDYSQGCDQGIDSAGSGAVISDKLPG
jgi:hypothetical protein